MRILLISSLAPATAGASPLILWRHLSSLSGVTVHVLSEEDTVLSTSTRLPVSKLLQRLENTRFHTWIRWFTLVYYRFRWQPLIRREISAFQPDLLLSLAHGKACFAVGQVARTSRVPLVMLFHDWWPDLTEWPRLARPWLDREFSALADHALSLCVSPGLHQALASSSPLRLLYPIPDPQPPALLPSGKKTLKPRWIYMGSMVASYGTQIAALVNTAKNRSAFQFTCYGQAPDLGARKIADFSTAYAGFLSRQELDCRLQEATGFIVTMSFLAADRRKAETSFPSKLTEYSRYGKPIVIWGPEYCSAVQWAKSTGGAECVTSPDPAQLADTLERLSQDPARCEVLGQTAQQAYDRTFHPDLLQKIFVDALKEAAGFDKKGK